MYGSYINSSPIPSQGPLHKPSTCTSWPVLLCECGQYLQNTMLDMLWLCWIFTSQQSVTDSLCPLPTTAMNPRAWTHCRMCSIPGVYYRGALRGRAALAVSSLKSEYFSRRSYCPLSPTWLARSHILTGSRACAGRHSVSSRIRGPCRMV